MSGLVDHLAHVGALLADAVLSPASRLFWLHLASAALLAYLAYRLRYRQRWRSFTAFLVPAAIWRHPSHLTDLKLLLVGQLTGSATALVTAAVASGTAALVWVGLATLFGTFSLGLPWQTGRLATLALLYAVIADFCTYWVHRLHHEHPVLWPFHAVHHSAEVMSPVTLFRKHPVYDLVSGLADGVAVGAAQGLLGFLLGGGLDALLIGGVNAVYFLFNLLGGNLRHSHVWIGYGPWLSRILISPAQHQIHHSRDPRHHNRNYGEVLAVWDWLFGTLYVPREREELAFGFADRHGRPLPQAHPSLRAALLAPFADSLRALRRARQRA